MEHLASTMDTEPTQDEFAVLDRAGRLQIPRELLTQMQLEGNRVHIEYRDGGIFIRPPESN